MAWHMGYPLSQTIFTSLHIGRILMPAPLSIDETHFDKIENGSADEPLTLQILRAYCLGLMKTCSFVNNRVKSEHYYEVCSCIFLIVVNVFLQGSLGRGFCHPYL
jgi:N-alpha-acetyltransferase 35, NatC auxiliary subunit